VLLLLLLLLRLLLLRLGCGPLLEELEGRGLEAAGELLEGRLLLVRVHAVQQMLALLQDASGLRRLLGLPRLQGGSGAQGAVGGPRRLLCCCCCCCCRRCCWLMLLG
jgi:hypothetical protein